MLDVEGECCVDITMPVVERLVRKTVHQVDAYIVDAGIAKSLDGYRYLRGGVATMQKSQAGIIEGLCAHGYAVDGKLL